MVEHQFSKLISRVRFPHPAHIMLSKSTFDLYERIITEAFEMVKKHVADNDLTWRLDFASIYSQSEEEFEKYTQELQLNGKVSLEKTTGNYYLLTVPLLTSVGIIHNCRVRKNPEGYKERGYIDFETVNHENFVKKYSTKDGFRIMPGDGTPMVELFDSVYDVRAYFPDEL